MIPKQLKYGDKVNSAMAQSYRTNIQPQNGTTAYIGQTVIINISITAKMAFDILNDLIEKQADSGRLHIILSSQSIFLWKLFVNISS